MKKRKLIFAYFLLIIAYPLFSRDWYVRPAGGNYGAENGTSYENAWDGLRSMVWGAGGVQAGDTLYVCGVHVRNYTSTSEPIDPGWRRLRPSSGTGESNRVIIRGDYPGDPGIVWGVYRLNHESWVDEGSNTYSITLPGPSDADWIFQDITASSWTLLDPAASLDACRSTPGTHYSSTYSLGSKLYVHCSDNGNPTGRICAARWGWSWQLYQGTQYVTFLNMQFYCHSGSFHHTGDYSYYTRWEGCTLKYGGHSLISLLKGGHHHEIVNCTMSVAGNGVYGIAGADDDPPDYITVRGCTIFDIGVRPITRNSDAHAIGIQGGEGHIIEDNYVYNCGNAILLYAYPLHVMRNNTIRRNFVKDCHTYETTGMAIVTQCSNTSLSDKSNFRAFQNIVKNCPIAYRFQWEDTQYIYNNVAVNCGISFQSYRTFENYGPWIEARNNISLNPTNYHAQFATAGTYYNCDYNYNLYYPITGSQFQRNSVDSTFSQWQALGYDTHSLIGDPKLTDGSGSYDRESDFQLQNSSPAIDRGVNVGLTQDRNGTSIPQGFAPDIGAYECVKPIYLRINASPSSGRAPLTVNFTANAIGDFPPFSFSWDFGDGQSSTAQNPSHTYTSSGNYTATLTVTESKNNMDSISVIINAYKTRRLSLSTETGAPSPGTGGTTNPSPGTHSFIEGSHVQLSVIPNLNYRFSLWNGDIINSDIYQEQTTIILDKDKSLTANFCTKCGDVNGDLSITPTDAQRAFDIFLGKIPNPTACEKENADVNCDGTKTVPRITPADAQAIFDKYLEKSELPSNCSGKFRATAIKMHRADVSNLNLIINDATLSPSEELIVPIIIYSSIPINAFGFDLSFPQQILEFIRLEKTEASRDFQELDANEVSPGMLRIGGYKSKSSPNRISSNIFMLLALIFKVGNPGKTKKVGSFSIISTYDDLQKATIQNAMIQWKTTETKRQTGKSRGKRIDDSSY